MSIIVFLLSLFLALYLLGSALGLIAMLLVVAVIALVADHFIPGARFRQLDWLGAIGAGLIGSLVGGLLMRVLGVAHVGPHMFGIALLPTLVGSALVLVALRWLAPWPRRR